MRNDLLPSDVLIHHSTDWRGVWTQGQWSGGGGDMGACHVEGIWDADTIAKMNPKVSSKYPAKDAPWDFIKVRRLHVTDIPGVPEWPGMDPAFQTTFRAECDAHMGEPYGMMSNVRFGLIGTLARVWPWAAQKVLSQPYNCVNHDCSQWLSDRIENAMKTCYHLTHFDLFDGTGVGDGEERPADYVKPRYLVEA